jgi:predicted dehydrogenase
MLEAQGTLDSLKLKNRKQRTTRMFFRIGHTVLTRGLNMTQKDKIGIGIVGCGAIAGVHAEAVCRAEGAELVSVYSRNREKAALLGKKHGVRTFSDWEPFIGDDRLDLVSVCTPSGTHLDYGRMGAEAGKHVVVEKPIEVTLERGLGLIDACSRNRVKLAVIFQNRFLTDAAAMKKAVVGGEIGKPFLADAVVKWYRDQAYYDGAPWRGTLVLDGGGVLINQAIHTVDLLQWMAGRVKTVWGQTGTYTHRKIEGEDNAVAALKFESGAIGVLEASASVVPAYDRKIEIHGDLGTAVLNGDAFRLMKKGNAAPATNDVFCPKAGGAASPLQGFSMEPHRKQFEAVVQAIMKNESPPVSGEESLNALAVVLAIYESAKTGMPVDVARF